MTQMDSNAVGLDVGTSRVVVARPAPDRYQYASQLNASVVIPFSKVTEGALRREGIPHAVLGSEIVVHGDESERFADLLGVEARRPMLAGLLNPAETDSLGLLRQIISAVTPAAPGTKMCFSVPAPGLGSSVEADQETPLRSVLTELGYEVRSINEGLAVVYAELESSNYTGIGISCGGGLCNVCLAYLSVPVLSFSMPRAGDYVDTSAAAITGEMVNRVRAIKENGFHLNGHYPDRIQQVIGLYYDELIAALVQNLKKALQSARRLPPMTRPIPVVLSGGTARVQGFRDRFEQVLRAADLPLTFSEVRLAEDPLHTTAKGALVCALAEM